jgi:hypothetical protein
MFIVAMYMRRPWRAEPFPEREDLENDEGEPEPAPARRPKALAATAD